MNHNTVSESPLEHAPLATAVRGILKTHHDFSDQHLEYRIGEQQEIIEHALGTLGTALELSRPTAVEDLEILTGSAERPEFDSFEAAYEKIRSQPVRKLEVDNLLAEEMLLKLGPTNRLRDAKGFDGGIAIGKVAHLLETDFRALPEAAKRPELRTTEALLREELALLWRTDTVKKFANDSHRAFMYDLNDPNVFTEEQVESVAPADRWKIIGARLSDEAADLFQEIAESPTARTTERLVARCRMTDMRIRSLRIQAGMDISMEHKQKLYNEIAELNTAYMGSLVKDWNDPATRQGINRSKFFEAFVVAQERAELIKSGQPNMMVRLALPREDNVHPKIFPYINRENTLVNMSVDVVVEDTKGEFKLGYQAKAMSERQYLKSQRKRERGPGKELYLPGRIEMRFIDSYPRDDQIDLMTKVA